VVIQRGGGQAGVFGDVANSGRRVAAGSEEANGGVANALASIGGLTTSLSS
jgi:hypothetical protein